MAPSREALAIAQIVFFGPVIVAAFLVCLRHGFSRDFGWVSLLLLSAARIAGSACEIAVNTSTPSVGLVTASLILNSGGLSALLLAMLGILKRVYESLRPPVALDEKYKLTTSKSRRYGGGCTSSPTDLQFPQYSHAGRFDPRHCGRNQGDDCERGVQEQR